MFKIPIATSQDKATKNTQPLNTDEPIIYIQGDGFKLINGFILLDNDDPFTFFKSLPNGIKKGLFDQYSLNYDESIDIAHLAAKLQPNFMVIIVIY